MNIGDDGRTVSWSRYERAIAQRKYSIAIQCVCVWEVAMEAVEYVVDDDNDDSEGTMKPKKKSSSRKKEKR